MKQTRSHPTLAVVAEKAGVGKTTVSRVINGARKVSPETLERVNRIITELGYQPNQAARSLKGDGTKSIGLIIPRIADPFFGCCAEAAQVLVRSYKYLLMVSATNYDQQAELNRRTVQGIHIQRSANGGQFIKIKIPMFGLRTLRFVEAINA